MKHMTKEKFSRLCTDINKKDKEILDILNGEIYQKAFPNKDYYPYIPFNIQTELYHVFKRISEADFPRSFIDIGAGTGRIVKLAKEFGIEKVCGVEYSKICVEMGRQYFNLTDEELICKDAFELDYEFLCKYKYIYTYHPISNPNLMSKLHVHLVNNSSYGAVIIEMLPSYYPVKNIMTLSRDESNYFWMNKSDSSYKYVTW